MRSKAKKANFGRTIPFIHQCALYLYISHLGVASLEERLKEIRGLLGEETEEGMRESIYSQDNSNSEESPVEIIP